MLSTLVKETSFAKPPYFTSPDLTIPDDLSLTVPGILLLLWKTRRHPSIDFVRKIAGKVFQPQSIEKLKNPI